MNTEQAIKQYQLALEELKRSRQRLRKELKSLTKRRGRKTELRGRPGRPTEFFFKWSYALHHKPAVDKFRKAVDEYLSHIADPRAAYEVFQEYFEEAGHAQSVGLMETSGRIVADYKRLVNDLCEKKLKQWQRNKTEGNLADMILALQEAQLLDVTDGKGIKACQDEIDRLTTDKKLKGAFEL